MDQVLFSEPSTKMKEKIEAIRAENEAKAAEEREADALTGKDKKIPSADTQDDDVSPEDKFLNERFGR